MREWNHKLKYIFLIAIYKKNENKIEYYVMILKLRSSKVRFIKYLSNTNTQSG